MGHAKMFGNLAKAVILVITVCGKSEGTFVCGQHKYHSAVIPTSEYHFMPNKKVLITSNPETHVQIVKFAAKNHGGNMSKSFYILKNSGISKDNAVADAAVRTGLFSIIKSLERNKGKTAITSDVIRHQIPSTTTSSPRVNPQHSTNMHIGHQVVNGHNYVYNVNNYGTHYHSYDSNSTENAKPLVIDLASSDVKKSNETAKSFVFKNDVKLA